MQFCLFNEVMKNEELMNLLGEVINFIKGLNKN